MYDEDSLSIRESAGEGHGMWVTGEFSRMMVEDLESSMFVVSKAFLLADVEPAMCAAAYDYDAR